MTMNAAKAIKPLGWRYLAAAVFDVIGGRRAGRWLELRTSAEAIQWGTTENAALRM